MLADMQVVPSAIVDFSERPRSRIILKCRVCGQTVQELPCAADEAGVDRSGCCAACRYSPVTVRFGAN